MYCLGIPCLYWSVLCRCIAKMPDIVACSSEILVFLVGQIYDTTFATYKVHNYYTELLYKLSVLGVESCHLSKI